MITKHRRIIRAALLSVNKNNLACVTRSPSVYAYENPELIKSLQWGRHSMAKPFLETVDPDFCRTLSEFRKTSAAASYSPHRPLDDSPYFVKTETMDDLNILLPHPDGTIKERNVVHIGPKGSGKTTVQNQWLKERHDDLEKLNVLYVRCDAPKIFDFWGKHVENPVAWPISSLPTVEEYLDFQTLYILAKYRDAGLPQKIFHTLKEQQIKFDFKEARAIDAPSRASRFVCWYLEEHIAKNIEVFEKGDPNRSYLRDSLFIDKPTRRREYFRWKECANAVRDWMRANNFIALRILDGVDNLHLNTDAGKSVFKVFLPQIRDFVLRSGATNEIRFAVMRNRTWIEVLNSDPATVGSEQTVEPRKIIHVPPKTEDLALARLNWLKKYDSTSECTKVLEAAVSVLPSGEILHYNMRTLIVGAASLAEQVRFRHHQLGGQSDIKRQASILMKRNLFLNGRFYLSTQRDFSSMNREKGLPYVNPFWFPDDHYLKGVERDPLFLRIHLLELLNTGDLLENELARILTETFCYCDECVRIAIDDARAFGWIDSKSEHNGGSLITYEISAAGRYLLLDLLCDVDVLYMLALDARLPKCFFNDNLIQVHSNHINQRSGYIGSATVTVFTFVSWLVSQLNTELSEVGVNNIKNVFTQEFLSAQALKKIMSHLKKILRHAEQEDWLLISSKCEKLQHLCNGNND